MYRPGQKVDQRTPSIPEENVKISPKVTSTNILGRSTGKENNPLIDPKYLAQTDIKGRQQTAPLQTQNRPNVVATGAPAPRPAPKIPLMSAYFPASDITGPST